LALAGAAACAAAAWLFLPVHGSGAAGTDRALRVCLVDTSAPMVRCRPRWTRWVEATLRDQARDAAAQGEDFAVLAFAQDVARVFGPGAAGEFALDREALRRSAERGDARDLSAALVAVEALATARPVALRLLSDRVFTGADPTALLAQRVRDGATFEALAPPPAELSDLALVALRTPEAIEAGAPLSLLAELVARVGTDRARGDVPFELEVQANEARTTVRGSIPRAAALASQPWSVRIDLGAVKAGVTSARVVARMSGSTDPIPENDALTAEVVTRGSLVVAFAGDERSFDDARAWSRAFGALGGLDTLAIHADELAPKLDVLDALVTVDLDPRSLPRDVVASFVERGGGWLACGGYRLLAGFDDERADALRALLPLRGDDDGDARDVILLVDGSGSMSGAAFDEVRGAAPALLGAARASDQIALRFFTDHLDAPIALGSGGASEKQRQDALAALLAARAPGGPTDVDAALSALAEERGPRRSLVLLLTDGRDQRMRGATAERNADVRAKLSAAKATLAVIAMGGEADLEFLAELARPDAVRRGRDAGEIARAFESELARGRVRDDAPIRVLSAPSSNTTSIGAELANAMRGISLPALDRSLRARVRDGDELVLLDEQGAALLAVRRAGGGLTATFASEPSAEWAPAWRDDVGPLGPLLRALARARRESPRPRAQIENGALTLRDVPSDWPAMLEARAFDLASAAVDPLGSAQLSMPTNGVAVDPRTVRAGPWVGGNASDARTVELRLSGAGDWHATLTLATTCAAAFEWPERRVGEFLTAGPNAGLDAGPRAPERPRPHAAGPWLLGIGLALLLAGGVLGATRP